MQWKVRKMHRQIHSLLAALIVGLVTPGSTRASYAVDHLGQIAENAGTSLLNAYLQDALRRLIEQGSKDYEGSLIEVLDHERHFGSSLYFKYLDGVKEPTEWARYFEYISTVHVDGRVTSQYMRISENYLSGRIVLHNPFNPYHQGKYSTDCLERVGPATIKHVTARGDTVWRLRLYATKLGRIMEEANGLQIVLRMFHRKLDPYCPQQTHPLQDRIVTRNVLWNGQTLIHPHTDQIYVPFVTYLGGSLWIR